MSEPGLFDILEHRRAPFAPGSATSKAAADALKYRLHGMRMRALEAYAMYGEAGATRYLVVEVKKMHLQTVCGRTSELVEDGLLVDTGREKRSGMGGMSAVMRVTVKGLKKLAEAKATDRR